MELYEIVPYTRMLQSLFLSTTTHATVTTIEERTTTNHKKRKLLHPNDDDDPAEDETTRTTTTTTAGTSHDPSTQNAVATGEEEDLLADQDEIQVRSTTNVDIPTHSLAYGTTHTTHNRNDINHHPTESSNMTMMMTMMRPPDDDDEQEEQESASGAVLGGSAATWPSVGHTTHNNIHMAPPEPMPFPYYNAMLDHSNRNNNNSSPKLPDVSSTGGEDAAEASAGTGHPTSEAEKNNVTTNNNTNNDDDDDPSQPNNPMMYMPHQQHAPMMMPPMMMMMMMYPPHQLQASSSSLYARAQPGRPLALQMDRDILSPYQCFLRQQIEFFAADQNDLDQSRQGRKRKIALGQVGIRCRYCVGWDTRTRGRGSVYFPAKLIGIYQGKFRCSEIGLALCVFLIDSLSMAAPFLGSHTAYLFFFFMALPQPSKIWGLPTCALHHHHPTTTTPSPRMTQPWSDAA